MSPSFVELPVGGLTCASCVTRVEAALVAVPGVRKASVDLATRSAFVTTDASTTVSAGVLVEAVRRAGYDAHLPTSEDGEAVELRARIRRLVLGAAFGLPVIGLAMFEPDLRIGPMGIDIPSLELLLTLPFLVVGGRDVLRAGLSALVRRAPDVNLLVSIGASIAFGWSVVATLFPWSVPASGHGGAPAVYFEAAVAILLFVEIGRVLEAWARRGAGDAVRDLVALVPAVAQRENGEEVPVAALVVGDRVVVRPGGRVPVDGIVREGRGEVDEALLTGESVPVPAGPGDTVRAGTTLHGGALRIEATAVGADTAALRIARAVSRARAARPPLARVADKVASRMVPFVLLAGLVTGLTWWAITGDAAVAVERAVAVLVVACPCAVGLAAPAAVLVGTGRAARRGILFDGGEAIEALASVDAVVLDKTGTLTMGRPEVVAEEGTVLMLAASAEAASEHPIGRAIVRAARAPLPAATEFVSTPGVGVQATVEGRRIEVRASPADGPHTRVEVLADGERLGAISLADPPRPAAAEVVAALEDLGVHATIASGDAKGPVEAVARSVGVVRAHARMLPEDKAELVRALARDGRRVAMVGDGVNDAPALAAATVGVAMGGGADVAADAAGVVLVGSDLTALPEAVRIARSIVAAIRRNLAWALGYNLVSVPLAAGVLAPLGFLPSPMLASAAMALSSVSVVLASRRA